MKGLIFSLLISTLLLGCHSDKKAVPKPKFGAVAPAIERVLTDLNSFYGVVIASDLDTAIKTQTEQVIKNVVSVKSKTDKGTLSLKKMESMTASITGLTQLIEKKKAENPLIPDELVALIAKAADDANRALELTKLALE